MGHQPLVELVVAGDEHGDRRLRFAPGPPGLLPHRRDRAGEAVEHAGVEPADVDAELERGGGDDAPQLAVEQLVFDLASLVGAGSRRGRGARVRAEVVGELPAGVGGHDLGALAAAAERDGAVAGCTSAATRRAVSRLADVRRPVRRRAAGFHSTNSRSPRGEPSSVTAATGEPAQLATRAWRARRWWPR